MTPLVPELFHGASEVERTARGLRPHRLPEAVRRRDADAQLLAAQGQPSGVRIVVSTRARRLDLILHATRQALGGGAAAPGRGRRLRRRGTAQHPRASPAGPRGRRPADGSRHDDDRPDDHVVVGDLPAGAKVVEFWLPHLEQVDVVGLSADADLRPCPRPGRSGSTTAVP